MPRKGRHRDAFPYEREDDFAHWAWLARAASPVLSGEEALREVERWAREARAGHPGATVRYVRHLLKNENEPRRQMRARKLLSPLVEREFPEALHIAGLMALRGDGEAPDEEKGLRLIERAAYLGRIEAVLDTARLYDLVFPDPAKALYWWRLAAAHGVTSAKRTVGMRLLAAARTDEDVERAHTYLDEAAREHDREAALALARLYMRRGPLQDFEASLYWLKESALGGDREAQFRLGVMHWAGQRVPVNQREAVRWIARAAEGGHFGAIEMLANLFLSGSAVPVNRVYGCALLRMAKRLGDKNAAPLLKSLTPLLRRREHVALRQLMLASPTAEKLVETILPRKSR